ncbi:hypothetical protein ABH916_000732 [Peribacillus frigoritolerans]|uniref:hypothetical protein n=1 Tax=Peribacillus frigoritolerans TaxID=450367 RepID=UPI00383731CC
MGASFLRDELTVRAPPVEHICSKMKERGDDMLMEMNEIEKRIDRIGDLTPVIERVCENGFQANDYMTELNEIQRLATELKKSGYRNVGQFGVKMQDVVKLIKKYNEEGVRQSDYMKFKDAVDKSVRAFERLPREETRE